MKNRVELLETGPLPGPLPHGCQPLPLFMQHSRRDFSTPLPVRLHCRTTPRPLQTVHFPCRQYPPPLPSSSSACPPLFPSRRQVSVGRILSPRGCCSSAPLIPPIHSQQGTSQLCLPKTLGYTTVNSSNHWGRGENHCNQTKSCLLVTRWKGHLQGALHIDSAREHHLPRQRFY